MSLDPKILNDAANEIRTAATRQRGQLALADALVGIASIENAADEAQARLDRLRADEAAMLASHASMEEGAKANAKARVVDADAYRTKRWAEADEAVAQATERAAQIVADAQGQATKTEADLEGALADRRAALEAAKTELAGVLVEIGGKRAELAAASEAHQTKQAELAGLAEQHQAFLASIGAK